MRYILLDKVVELSVGKSARGIKAVSLTDEILHDHFPGYPVLPGSLLVEAAAQLAGFLIEVTEAAKRRGDPQLPAAPRAVLVQIEKAKFFRPAEPGDVLNLEVQLEQTMEAAARVSVSADIDGEKAMRGRLMFMLRSVNNIQLQEQRRELYALWTRRLPGEYTLP